MRIQFDTIDAEGELDAAATCKADLQVRQEGGRPSVGYRVRSHRGTQFRQWATERLREYIVKGFFLDDERLKQSSATVYFDELLDRIRDNAVQIFNSNGVTSFDTVG